MQATQQTSHTTLIDAARDWYDAGYCVIPSNEDGGKRPFGTWRQYQHQRPDWEHVKEWLASGRYTGIGILTGTTSGNCEMIEIEGPIDDAVTRLQQVIEHANQYADIGVPELLYRISRGCVEKSAGGGLHLFIRISDGPAHGNTKLAHTGQGQHRKVIAETRGEGGFVVVAPTPARNGHPDGTTYMFINGGHPTKTVTVTAEERDILHLLFTQALDEPDDITPPPAATPTSTYQHDPHPLSAFDDYRQRVTWRDILEPRGWQYSHHADGRDHWTRPGKPIHDGTSATTIEDGPLYCFSTSTPLPAEQGLSKGQVYAHLDHNGDTSAAAKALIKAGYGDPTLNTDLAPWEAVLDPDADDDERNAAASEWVRERLPLLDWHHLWADETEEEWLVEPLLAKRRLIALYSAPKIGKSLLMLEIAAALAAGRQVLGNTPTNPIRTLYVDFENDPRGDIRERLRDMGYGPDDLHNLCYLSYPTLAKLDTKTGADELLAAIHEYQCEVVVIDTVSRSVAGDENENDTWLNFYRHTGLRLKQAEIALIRLDHSGKDEKKGQRGGSAKSGDVDAVWRLTKTRDNGFSLICEANRFPIAEKKLDLERVDNGQLHHRVDMQARNKAQEEMFKKLAKAGVPRDPKFPVTKAREMIRAAALGCANGQLNSSTIEAYARRLPTFETPEMDIA